jgi:hypothetical protein
MSITSGAAALVRLAHVRTKGGSPGGRALRNVVLMAGVSAAYLAGSRRAAESERAQLERLAELERRLEQLEQASLASSASAGATGEARRLHAVGSEPTVDKTRAASHYEVLATQLACERQIVEIEDRLSAVERIGANRSLRPVWLASSNGTATEFRRRG